MKTWYLNIIFIAIEQKLMCCLIYLLYIMYSILNIYCRQVKNVFLFLEEMILNIDGSTKPVPAYLQISAAIGCLLQREWHWRKIT